MANLRRRFRLETLDDSLQPTIDMLLNLSIFIWYGAVCPWASFRVNDVIPIYRLIFLGILILLFRRVPVVMAMHKKIPEIEHFQQAAFVGFFGPIGVSAIFYLYVSIEFLTQVTVDGTPNGVVREDAAHLIEVMRVVIWFLAICSIVVHGLSVPLGKLGYRLPRTMSAFSTSEERDESERPFHLRERIQHVRSDGAVIRQRRHPAERPQNAIFRVGGSVIKSQPGSGVATPENEPSRPIKYEDSTSNSAEHTAVGSQADLEGKEDGSVKREGKRIHERSSSDESAQNSNGEGSSSSPDGGARGQEVKALAS